MNVDASLGKTEVRTIGVADLAAGAAHTPLLTGGGVLDAPVLVVDLDGAPDDLLPVAADRARDCDRLLVGRFGGGDIEDAPELGLLLDALDLTYVAGPDPRERTVVGADDLDEAIAGFVAAVIRNPYAALTAGQVLRAAETLPVPAAIDVESLGYSTLQGGPEFHRWLDERGPRPLPPPAPQEPVLIARDGDTLHITLNRPERRNAVKLLMFFDVGGSMDDHIRIVEELFSAARGEFRHMEHFYFHNCVYEGLWKDNRRRRVDITRTTEVLRTFGGDYRAIFVGDASMSPYEISHPGGSVEHWNDEAGALWLSRMTAHFPRSIWLNPVPEQHWGYTQSIAMVRKLFEGRMFPLTLAGLQDATKQLSR